MKKTCGYNDLYKQDFTRGTVCLQCTEVDRDRNRYSLRVFATVMISSFVCVQGFPWQSSFPQPRGSRGQADTARPPPETAGIY